MTLPQKYPLNILVPYLLILLFYGPTKCGACLPSKIDLTIINKKKYSKFVAWGVKSYFFLNHCPLLLWPSNCWKTDLGKILLFLIWPLALASCQVLHFGWVTPWLPGTLQKNVENRSISSNVYQNWWIYFSRQNLIFLCVSVAKFVHWTIFSWIFFSVFEVYSPVFLTYFPRPFSQIG